MALLSKQESSAPDCQLRFLPSCGSAATPVRGFQEPPVSKGHLPSKASFLSLKLGQIMVLKTRPFQKGAMESKLG